MISASSEAATGGGVTSTDKKAVVYAVKRIADRWFPAGYLSVELLRCKRSDVRRGLRICLLLLCQNILHNGGGLGVLFGGIGTCRVVNQFARASYDQQR